MVLLRWLASTYGHTPNGLTADSLRLTAILCLVECPHPLLAIPFLNNIYALPFLFFLYCLAFRCHDLASAV